MTTYVSFHPHVCGTRQELNAVCYDDSVPGALNIDVKADAWHEHHLTIFLNDHEMAKELANAINTITAKYKLKIAA